jgi:hypothetical protein
MGPLVRGFAAPIALAIIVMAPAAASAVTVADWEMNETSGAVMHDSSGNGLNGDIGSAVQIGVSTGTGLGFRFPGGSGAHPERLATIPDTAQLDPGTGPYAVTIRIKTSASEPNIVQKGQSGQRGGYWKFVLKRGWPRCHFRDSNGHTKAIGFVNGPASLKVNDNQWHTLRCERTATGVRVTEDYGTPDAVSKFIGGSIGTIDNSRPFSIGGKRDCNGGSVGCDYFNGQIDWVRVEKP